MAGHCRCSHDRDGVVVGAFAGRQCVNLTVWMMVATVALPPTRKLDEANCTEHMTYPK